MINIAVTIQNNEPRAGTLLIAQGFDRDHRFIKRLLNKYSSHFENLGTLKTRKIRTKGKPIEEYLLNENQTMFLGALLKNSEAVIKFKLNLVKEFSKAKRQLEAFKSHQSTDQYQIARVTGKIVRREAMVVIQQFVIYAEERGSCNAKRYYSNFSSMVNNLLFTFQIKFKNLRDVISAKQLMTISSAEKIIEKALIDGMALNKPYKEIYQNAKSKVSLFAEIHGQSAVIASQYYHIGGEV